MKILNNNYRNSFSFIWTFILIVFLVFGCGRSEQNVFNGPTEPEDALKTFELADQNLSIELFVSEPLISDPVDMEIDEDGNLYVMEMPGYPLDTDGSGRIKLIQDMNGDGRPDESVLFADGLILPTGIMRWKEGVIVTDAPDVIYFEDNTGDGRADIRKSILTGFALSNPQHNFNNPLYGIDNWIYIGNEGTISTELYADKFGDEGSEIRFTDHPNGPILPRNGGDRNIRFRPDELKLEMLSSHTQFGHNFDKWGRHFLVSNSRHNFHEAIAKRYLDRNPDLQIRRAVHDSPTHSQDVYPITENPMHQLLTDVGVFTAASGMIFNSGNLLGDSYDNVSFVGESQHNFVHSDVIKEQGSVFEARRQFDDREFLASTDSWFRPVNFYIGPDGALYILDYYRQFIEHPEWMDEQTMEEYDIHAGIDRGRIYRITSGDDQPIDWLNNLNLSNAEIDDLVQLLEHENIWWRKNAQRLIVDQQNPNAIEPLREIVFNSDHSTARLHALWTLEGLRELDSDLILEGLTDEESGVRENAIKLAELYEEESSLIHNALKKMENDSSSRVRYQLLLTLGNYDDPETQRIRQRMLFEHIEDQWFQIAYLSAPSINGIDMLEQSIVKLGSQYSEGRSTFFGRVGAMIAASGHSSDMKNLISRTAGDLQPEAEWWQEAVLEGFADQVQRSDLDPNKISSERDILIDSFFNSNNSGIRSAAIELLDVIGLSGASERLVTQKAITIVKDRDMNESLRADAIRLIGMTDPDGNKDLLFELITPTEPRVVQQASLRVLAQLPGEDIGEFVLNHWEKMTPQVRDQAINVLMGDPSRVEMLLDAVEENKILVSTIGWGRRVSLMRDKGGDEEARALRDRARELLSRDPAARKQVVEEYKAAVEQYEGNRERGKEIFTTVCGTCHQMGGELGTAFGPDAATFQHWTPQALIAKILDPNRSVADGYDMWIVELENGGTVSGVMVNEMDQSITLRSVNGSEMIIARSEIESITGSSTSPMPEGLEQRINEEDMANLITFIRSGGM